MNTSSWLFDLRKREGHEATKEQWLFLFKKARGILELPSRRMAGVHVRDWVGEDGSHAQQRSHLPMLPGSQKT